MQDSCPTERPAVLGIGRTLFYFLSMCFALCLGSGTPSSVSAQTEPVVGTRRILALRVSFPVEVPDDETTSGDGAFDLRSFDAVSDNYRFPFDVPPHDRTYFEAHLEALANYYRTVSQGRLELTFEVFPRQNEASYEMDQPLIEFGNGRTRQETNERLVRLFRDALLTADASDPEIDFSDFDHVVVFHAGIGGESSNALNDVLSAFINFEDLETYADGAVNLDGTIVSNGMLLPEAGSLDGRGGLNGLLARFYANQLGLPRLDNPEDGLPAVGDWSLMDTGNITVASSAQLGLSNLSGSPTDTILVGFVPSRLLAWSRAALGWLDVPTVTRNDTLRVAAPHVDDGTPQAIRVPINTDEYFLIENRLSRLAVEGRTPTVTLSNNGVWTAIDDYDAFIPGSGILIWHVDDAVIRSSAPDRPVNSHPDFRVHFDGFAGVYRKGLALEEADGLEDIGNASSSRVISSGVISFASVSGSTVDPYYVGNATRFGPDTLPASDSNLGYSTGIEIEVLSPPGEVMEVAIRFGRQPDAWPVTDLTPDRQAFPRVFEGDDGTLIIRSSQTDPTVWQTTGDPGTIDFTSPYPVAVGTLAGANDEVFIYATADGGALWRQGQSQLVSGTPSSVPPVIAPFPTDQTDIWGLVDGSVEWGRFTSSSGRVDLSSDPIAGVAVGNIDPDAGNEMAVLTASNRLFLVNDVGDFNELAAFPNPVRGPVTADLNADGVDDIVVVSHDGIVFTAQFDGTLTQGRPLAGGAHSPPVLADIDRDGFVEVLFGGVDKVWVTRFNGVLQQDAPISLPLKDRSGPIEAPPLVVDADADGDPDILVATGLGLIYGLDAKGNALPGLPVATLGAIATSPLIDDLDGDGNLELVAYTVDGTAHLWHLDTIDPSLTGTNVVWGQQGGGPGNTGRLSQTVAPREPPTTTGILPADRVYCYPNPIRDNEAYLRFYLTQSADVTVAVINPRGEIVDRLTATQTHALTDNEIRWDTSDYASGFYICRVEAIAGSQSEIRFVKVAVVR